VKYKFLKKSLILYSATGVLAGIACFCFMLLTNYRESLADSVSRFSNITIKTVKMKNTIVAMDRAMESLRVICPWISTQTGKEAILLTADAIQRMLQGGEVTLKDMTHDSVELMLPLQIKLDGAAYSDIVTCVGYLQSYTVPFVTIEKINLTRQSDAAADNRMLCTLDVSLRMPDDGK